MLQVIPHFNLLPLNTFHIKAKAFGYTQIAKEEELLQLKDNFEYSQGVFVLGGGSNILFTQDLDKWVLHNKIKGIEQVKEDENHVWLKVGAGEIWHEFVRARHECRVCQGWHCRQCALAAHGDRNRRGCDAGRYG